MMSPPPAQTTASVDLEMAAKTKQQRKIRVISGRLRGAMNYVATTLAYFETEGRVAQGVDEISVHISVKIPSDPVFDMWQREHDERIRRTFFPSAPKE